MAIFARRCLQRVLDENAVFLSARHLRTACDLLNTVRDDYLATEWEQVILNAASKWGAVKHEPKLGPGRRTPDLWFTASEPPLDFVADVTTVSDVGLHKQNQSGKFMTEFERRAREAGFERGGFCIQFDWYPLGVRRGGKRRVQLKLPRSRDWGDKIFSSDFRSFLARVIAQPGRNDSVDVVTPDTGVHFAYDPTRPTSNSFSHLSYTVAKVIDQNPVYCTLEAKAGQLRDVRYLGLKGIFLCDGGCQMLHARSSNGTFYFLTEILRFFFARFAFISFVATFVVRHRDKAIEPALYVNPAMKNVPTAALSQIVAKIHESFPVPEAAPDNAMIQLRTTQGKCGRHIGGLTMNGVVEMSARKLLELLAGTKSLQEFESEYWRGTPLNPFRRKLEEGRLISKVTVEPHPGADDDRVIIEFGEVDPAVSPFRVRTASK